MKVLLVNHGRASEWGGGDGVQIRETQKRLEQRGHQVDAVNADNPDTQGYDIVHIFNSRVIESLRQQIYQCKANGVKVVISPIWVSINKALWGSRGSVGILQKGVAEGAASIEGILQEFKQRKLSVKLQDGTVVESTGEINGSLDSTREISNLLKQADGLIPNSYLELQAVRSDHQWYKSNFEVAHYGVDPKIFLEADPKTFREQTGIKSKFVMQAGRIEPAKNQAMLCWALRKSNVPVVLIGSKKHWPSYAELCKEILGDRLTIIEHLPQELLSSAYAAAGVHVLPSWMETCGLVTLEAALSGTPVVGSTFGHELEYLQNDAEYGDPADPESICDAVLNAIEAGKYNYKACNLKKRILEDFNWEKTTEKTEKMYKVILNENA